MSRCVHSAVLLARGEPYRVLFPLGLFLGALGVLLWPAFVYGWLPMYPGVVHARLMVQGFAFSFIAGFLLSAMPHMLEVRGPSAAQTLGVAVTLAAVSALHLLQLHAAADLLFVAAIVQVIALVAARFPERADLPPPGFVLAALGLFSGAAGSLVMAAQGAGLAIPPLAQILGRLLLLHGLLLFPVLGVAVYMVPRLVGLPNRHLIVPKSAAPSADWYSRAAFMLLCGLVMLAGLVVEAAGQVRTGYLLRGIGMTAGLWHGLPLHRIRNVNGTIAWGLLVALVSVLAGVWMIAVWPERAMSLIHVVMISGAGLLVLLIAARVVLGHSGQGAMIPARSRAVRWVIGLVLLAMSTRVSADLIPSMQLSHYAYAAMTWLVITALWIVNYGPLVLVAPSVERQEGKAG